MVRRALKSAVIAMASLSMMMESSIPDMAKTRRPDTEGQWKLEKQAWSFQDPKANTVKGWMVYKGDWYFLDENSGFLKTGWMSQNGKSYFFNTEKGSREGALLSGWNWIDGYCYYFSEKDDESYGELQKSTTTADAGWTRAEAHTMWQDTAFPRPERRSRLPVPADRSLWRAVQAAVHRLPAEPPEAVREEIQRRRQTVTVQPVAKRRPTKRSRRSRRKDRLRTFPSMWEQRRSRKRGRETYGLEEPLE